MCQRRFKYDICFEDEYCFIDGRGNPWCEAFPESECDPTLSCTAAIADTCNCNNKKTSNDQICTGWTAISSMSDPTVGSHGVCDQWENPNDRVVKDALDHDSGTFHPGTTTQVEIKLTQSNSEDACYALNDGQETGWHPIYHSHIKSACNTLITRSNT